MGTHPMIASGRPADGGGTTDPPNRPLSDQAVLVLDVGNSTIAVVCITNC